MAKKGFWLVLAMALVFGLLLLACKADDDGGGGTAGVKIEGENICAVHGVEMESEKVKMRYGFYSGDFKYEMVRNAYFPHSDDPVLGGCLLGTPFVIDKLVCRLCNEARDERRDNSEADWLAE
ncbi:MAG: hypothetical protein LBT68_02310, partial [Spirochaetales bacterium]|nr:hypothetical protein [Spirochaetales bacterium]